MRFDSGSSRRWGLSLALLLPVLVVYAANYFGGDGRSFTGFIQYDQAYYMADARKFFDGGFHFLYSNPFSADPNAARIYFQIHLFVLGLIEAVTGCDPGVLYVIFGFVAALVCVRLAVSLYEEVAGLGRAVQGAGLVLFVWGGGGLAVAGLLNHAMSSRDFHALPTDLFVYDPAQGWWFLNLGRNLIYPTEAYYHALALGAVLTAMRRNFRASVWLALALSFSHPFTGLQFLFVLLAWSGAEKIVFANRAVPLAFPVALAAILAFHLFYNLILLNLFFEHRAVFLQWSTAWVEPMSVAFLADLFVGFFAIRAMWSWPRARELFSQPMNRLLLAWFLVSFALVHHEWLVSPRQPLHFSRGYTWAPLFLLGVQPLLLFLKRCFSLSPLPRFAALALIFLVGLSDNLAWFGVHTAMAIAPRLGVEWLGQDGFRLSRANRQLYAWLMTRSKPHDAILITPDGDSQLVYLAMTYTDYRGWYSHYDVTPFANQRIRELGDYFQAEIVPEGWRGQTILVLLPGPDFPPSAHPAAGKIVFKNDGYEVREIQF